MIIKSENALTYLKQKIDKLLKNKTSIVIAIDGMAASGKTSLAKDLKSKYKATIIHMDDFFLQDHQRTNERFKEIAGFIDYERFNEEVMQALKSGYAFSYHKYNCQSKTMTKEYVGNDNQVYIIEGAYSLREEFQDTYDIKVLMLIDEDKQITRIKARNNASLLRKFKEDWLIRENTYIKEYKLKEMADIIIQVK